MSGGMSVGSAGSMAWQPLSMSALGEYKAGKIVLGNGDFNQGKTAVWSVSQ